MKRLFSFLTVVAIIVLCLGSYRGWFTVSGGREADGNKIDVGLTLDRDKVKKDAETVAVLSGELIYQKRAPTSPKVIADTQTSVPMMPIVGGIGIACGATLIMVRARKSSSTIERHRAGLRGLKEAYQANRAPNNSESNALK